MREGDADPEQCKDPEGNWTKWIVERCSQTEREAYDQLNELCQENLITNSLTTNHKLRFLSGCFFDVDMALEELIKCEKWRYENSCDTLVLSDVY